MPPMLTCRKEEDIMEAGVCGMAVVEGLKSASVSSLVEDDIAWTGGFSDLVTRNDDSNLVSDREVVTSFVPDAMKFDRALHRSILQ